MRKSLLSLVTLLAGVMLYAQVTGTVVDFESGEGLPGATVVEKGSGNGTVTDINGAFSLEVSGTTATIEISFIGFETYTVDVNAGESLGKIALSAASVGLEEVQVIASYAVDRKTPVAVSTIRGAQIQARVGNQEFPEVLRYTPSIYATKQGGGFGDARINVRGFDQRNTAVMINGIPVNDMENGWVYWSNWAGLSDVSSGIQVQRGLSASKLAVSSVGGTINIITKAADIKKGGSVSAQFGNDAFMKYGVALNSGLLDNGWAFSFQGTRTQGNGYIDGTQFSAWSYFGSVSKTFNEKHTLVLTGLGAPQWHHQNLWSNFDNYNLEDLKEENLGRKYNELWGELDGEEFSWRKNFYHKPKVFLNHYFDMSDKARLNTSAYFSMGNGGGTGPRGRTNLDDGTRYYDGAAAWRNADGTVRWDDIVAWQSGSPNSGFESEWDSTNVDATYGNYATSSGNGMIRRASMNYHTWTGILSTFDVDLNDNLNLTVGLDARHYLGEHFRRVENLLGLDAYLSRANDNNSSNYITTEDAADFGSFRTDSYKTDEENVLNYYNDGLVKWLGLFTQLEYSTDQLSAFLALSGSNQAFKRIDYFNYAENDPERETDWFGINGGTVKAGANYNLSARSNVFVNGGILSRQPLFDAVYVNFVNDLNDELNEDLGGSSTALNELIKSIEVGYGYTAPFFKAKVNLYSTNWGNRTFDRTLQNDDQQDILYQFTVDQVHQGFELEVTANPMSNLEVRAMASIGSWKYANDFTATGTNIDSLADTRTYESTLELEGQRIGDAAQTTFSLGASYEVFSGFRLRADFIYYDNLYAQWSVGDDLSDGVNELPAYSLVDLGFSYNVFTSDSYRVSLNGNVNNLLDTFYISEMFTNNTDDLYDNEGFIGFGRTWNAGVRVSF
jgi:hypothetical protein